MALTELTDEQKRAVEDFRREMREVVIPEIEEIMFRRRVRATETRHKPLR
jgi:hypothetical protein